ncbi:hypothetical protein [Aeromonas jandaei]|nr:hypothetical protein [Aeromonas jandaei]
MPTGLATPHPQGGEGTVTLAQARETGWSPLKTLPPLTVAATLRR